MVDVTQIEVGCHPAGQQQHLAADGGRDIGVAVAVAAHPGSKAQRRGSQWKTQPSGLMQHLVDMPKHIG
ncbi:hypothetical protein D3C77_762070 [compost metagenome]